MINFSSKCASTADSLSINYPWTAEKKEEEASQLSLILSAYLESFTMTSLLKSSIAFRGTENEFVSDKALGWVNDIFLNYFR